MIPASDATLFGDMQELVFARARRAVREIRAQARAAGTDGLTSADIEQEIKEARRTRTGDAGRE
jgi:t-SNARE complex subunit (syntaxin)